MDSRSFLKDLRATREGYAIHIPRPILEALMKHRTSLSAEWPRLPEVIQMAEAHRFLPLVADMGGVCGLTAEGNVVAIGWDDSAPKLVESPRFRDIALLQAVKHYPELKAAIPARASGARTCPSCAGAGVPQLEGQVLEVTCSCGGLGWIPLEWDGSR